MMVSRLRDHLKNVEHQDVAGKAKSGTLTGFWAQKRLLTDLW